MQGGRETLPQSLSFGSCEIRVGFDPGEKDEIEFEHMEVLAAPFERCSMLSSILQKPLGAITVLGTAIGGPYALFETDAGTAARVAVQSLLSSTAPQSQPNSSTPPAGGVVIPAGAPIPHSMLLSQNPTTSPQSTQVVPAIQEPAPWTPPPIDDIREVIRFDMTPMALPQRFGQVTTLTGYAPFDVYRVALVSGTRPSDLVGTLTYFFNESKAVQRIQFNGTTGDPSMIAGMMVQYYGLRPEASLGGQLFTSRWNNRITSLLQVRPANVISAASPNTNYLLFLELNQPSAYYGLSDDAHRLSGVAPPPPSGSLFGF